MVEVVKFPSNKIVRYDANNQQKSATKDLNTYRAVRENAKNVYDNLVFELFDTYKLARTKEVEMELPLLEDIILGIFKRNADIQNDDPEPPPLQYA